MGNSYYDNSDPGTRFQPGTTVSAEEVDQKFDAISTGFGAVKRDVDRSIKVPAGTSDQLLDHSPLARRNRFVGFDSEGNVALLTGLNWRGDWSSNTEYFVGDMLRAPNGNLYVNKSRHVSGSVFDDSMFSLAVDVDAVRQARRAAESAQGGSEQARDLAKQYRNEADLAAQATAADRQQTELDRMATGEHVTLTAADRQQTGLDRTATSKDAIATAADRKQTGLDRQAVATDRTHVDEQREAINTAAQQVGQDAQQTAADRVQTGLNRQAAEQAKNDTTALYGNAQALQTAVDIVESFDDKYWGAFASDPSASPHGVAPYEGAIYFNTARNVLMIYTDNAGWVFSGSLPLAQKDHREYVSSEGQTTFACTYQPGYVQVFLNGWRLPSSEYTATDGSNIVLTSALAAGQDVLIEGMVPTMDLDELRTNIDQPALHKLNAQQTRLARSLAALGDHGQSMHNDFIRRAFALGDFDGLNRTLSFAGLFPEYSRLSPAKYWDAIGVLRTAGIDEPRLDHDPVTGEALGFLGEGSAANIFTVNNDLTLLTRQGASSVIAEPSIVGPDGETGRVVRISEAVDFSNRVERYHGNAATNVTDKWATGVLVRAVSGTAQFTLAADDGGGNGFIKRATVGEQWQWLVTDGTEGNGFEASISATRMWRIYNQVGDIYIAGAQLEEGSRGSSFIYTEGAPLTRADDVLFRDEVEVGDVNSGFTIVAEYDAPAIQRNQRLVGFSIGDMDGASLFYINGNTAEGTAVATNIASHSFVGIPIDTQPGVKVAASLNGSELLLSANGSPAISGGSVTDKVAVPTRLILGAGGGPFGPLNGHIRWFMYIPHARPAEFLQEITA